MIIRNLYSFQLSTWRSHLLFLKISHDSKLPPHSRIAASALSLPVPEQRHSSKGSLTKGQSLLG
jgi:hypothetical protein